MTVRHHISDEILVSYAAGSLAEGWSLLVATHLALCPHCRVRSRSADAVGGWLLESLEETPVSSGALQSIIARIDRDNSPLKETKALGSIGPMVLPEPLRSYLGGDLEELKWRRLGPRVHHVPIKTSDSETRAGMLRIRRGMAVPRHGHGGRELTLVLAGTLCDGDAVFAKGDVEETDESVVHQPIAGPDEDCVCLAVTDALLRFKTVTARLLQPFFGI
jgi:putative transcriptional regulator